MEFRKLISFGKGSFVVSLPKDWVEQNKLKKGALLSLDKTSRSVVVSTDFSEREEEKTAITIAADDKSIEQLQAEIVTAYLSNYDIIEVIARRFEGKEEKIKEIVMNLAGLEILEQTATKITAKYLLDIKEISLDSLIRRIDNITRSLILDAIQCVDGACNYKSIKQRDADVNRLNFLIHRTVRKAVTQQRDPWNLFWFMRISRKLERIADTQKRIAKDLENLKLSEGFAAEMKEAYGHIYDSYLKVMKSYYETDKNAALEIELSHKQRTMECDQLLSKELKDEYKIVRREAESLLSTHIHEHMVMTEIITNLKLMATDIKNIARGIMSD